MVKNNHFETDMEAKNITDNDLNKFKNIIKDNKKIYNIQRSIDGKIEEVEFLLIKLGDFLEDLYKIKLDIDDIESRLHEKFELLNDKFYVYLDQIMKDKDLNCLVDILLENPHFQEKVMERILDFKNKQN